jgi:hypothetical protein
MLKFAVGHSNDPDSEAAIIEVLEQCDHALAGERPQAGLLFAAIDFDHTLILRQICQTFPGIQLIGGTTDGEISSVLGFQQDSLTLLLFCSDTITLQAGIGREVSQNPIAAAQTAIAQASAGNPDAPKLCITIAESLTVSGVEILESLKQTLGSVPIFGGLTADQWRFKQTYQFFQTEVCSDAVAILLLSGSVVFSHGIANGWHPIGQRGQVTKVDKNVVYEIDNKPALKFYQRYFGQLPPTQEYPLAVFDGDGEHYYVRAPSSVYDPVSGSITFFGDIPEQAIVQITEASRDDILSASQASMTQALENYPGKAPATALFFSCASRRQILGSRTKEEYEGTQHGLTQALPSCGFYTNGEIAPLKQQGSTLFHNETFITLLLGEA